MIDNERTPGLELNPYDRLIGQEPEPVRSPVILESNTERESLLKKEEPIEIMPLSPQAVYDKLMLKEYKEKEYIELEVEEDLLVPDAFPDMEMILNMDAEEVSINIENGGAEAAGEIKIETIYRSAENYGNNVTVISAKVPFRHPLKIDAGEGESLTARCEIHKLEYHIINERKYKVRAVVQIRVTAESEKEKSYFAGIDGEPVHLQRENVKFLNLVSLKNSGSDINEELLLHDEKIRPVKILKSKFTVSENHCQLTKEKLLVNQTIWVRILYLAEMASKGNLSNQAMFFQGKIDNTAFIALGKDGDRIQAFSINPNGESLSVEINRESSGFSITGEVNTEAYFYDFCEKEIVKDFYHDNEDTTCDYKTEEICSGLMHITAEETLRETINHQQDPDRELRVIYTDAQVPEYSLDVEGSSVVINGKLQLEVVLMNEGDFTVVSRKVCDFRCSKEIPSENICRADKVTVFVREITADVVGSSVNVNVQVQACIDMRIISSLCSIENPCILRSGETSAQYPITVYAVKEGESLWDISKKFRAAEESIIEVNGAECIRPGNKIVIIK